MRPTRLSLTCIAPRALRCALAALVFASSLAWAAMAPAHAQAIHHATVEPAHCPGHPHAISTGPSLGLASERSPLCAALCAVTELAQTTAQIAAPVGIDGVKLAIPAPKASEVPRATHWRVADMPSPGADPPLYLTTVRFRI